MLPVKVAMTVLYFNFVRTLMQSNSSSKVKLQHSEECYLKVAAVVIQLYNSIGLGMVIFTSSAAVEEVRTRIKAR